MIAGFNQTSYIDYPGEISSVLFLAGCNFKCPWCHNSNIVKPEAMLDINHIIDELTKRFHLVNHVVITGGEPTLYQDKLIDLLKDLKQRGFVIKLDTNGSNPTLLKVIIDNKLVDYIAMDIKNTWLKYEMTIGCNIDISLIQSSIKLIENSGINYQFRTTVNKTMHDENNIAEIRTYLNKPNDLVLQNYRYSNQQINDYNYGSVDFI